MFGESQRDPNNIRFKQIPRQTASSQKYWCYDFNDDALSGDGCGGKGGGKDDESVSGSGEDEEDEGQDHHHDGEPR
mgnify:CR=1 FL=1